MLLMLEDAGRSVTILHKIYPDFTVASCHLPFLSVKMISSMKEQGE